MSQDTPKPTSLDPDKALEGAGNDPVAIAGDADETPEQKIAREEARQKAQAEQAEVKASAQKAAASAQKKPVSNRGLDAVLMRNDFYRDGYRALKMAVLALTLAVLLLGGIIFYLVNTQDIKHVYFATTEDGRLVKMLPLTEPNLSTPALMSWTAQAVAQTMTFGFHDYRKRLQESSRFFTRPGWAKFTEALEKSGIMDSVEANKQVVTAAPSSAPTLISEGIVNGRYEWLVEVPMNITYKAGSQVRADSPTIRLKIVRVPKLESAHGVGIEQWLQ